jgi:hypothetical protein
MAQKFESSIDENKVRGCIETCKSGSGKDKVWLLMIAFCFEIITNKTPLQLMSNSKRETWRLRREIGFYLNKT